MTSFFEADEFRGKAYDGQLMRRLYKFLRPHAHLAFIGIFLGVLVTGIQIALPLIQGLVVADFNPSRPLESGFLDWLWRLFGYEPVRGFGAHLWGLSLIFLFLAFCRFILEVTQHYILQIFGQRGLYDLRVKLFEHLMDMPMQFYHKNPVGRLVTRVSNDVESLQEFISIGLVDLTRHFFMVVAVSITLPIIALKLGFIALALLPVLIIVSLVFRYFARQAYRNLRKQISHLNAYLSENIGGMPIIQAFHREDRHRDQFGDINLDLRDKYISSIKCWALYSPAVSFLEGLSLALIIYFGAFYVTGAEIDLATLSVFIWLTELYFEPIKHLAEKYNILQSAMASCERIFKIMDEEMDPSLLPPAGMEVYKDGRWGKPVPSPLQGSIEFRKVNFSYIPGTPVLKDINLDIKPGEKVALVGHTGAGKSTLAKLLLRFYNPDSGKIYVDGQDLSQIHPKNWRDKVVVVPQDVFLFRGTISENIRLWEDSITDEEVEQACRHVGAHDFICQFQEGYQHKLEEGAKTLSSGERQLLSFARALAHKPSILILDEATSLIDTQTEKMIQDALKELLKGQTSLIIAHRLSTIQDADKIVVIQKGKIVEQGDHQSLIDQEGIYHDLYQLQYSS